ncbi:radical SAM (seleno)protein TrsS [Oscillibacter sp.]|uniref:radical SAM (seleno)protein TrsS n=1 Tax=Oscillibacter sp. TaxID=1945593 RepID=UPI003396DEB5
MKENRIITRTESLCPICLRKVEAFIVTDGAGCYLKKSCPEHGAFSALIWRGSIPIENWMRHREGAHLEKTVTRIQKGCPYDCGLCEEHRQHTCTALIEVTQRCNLHCKFCFADSGASEGADLSLEQIKTMYEAILSVSGTCNIQLSGGEPTVRDDLPGIVKLGKELGFPFIQVNTNGIRLAQEEEFVRALKVAGLDSVFLQFDGTKDDIYRKLRGRELLTLKEKAIANCEKYHMGVVLVPTLVPGVNVDNIGAIIRFALDHIRAVRGVHFQPVSYFGRMPHAPADSDRVTLPEVMDELERQTGGKVKAADLKPAACENSLCSFHGNFIRLANGDLMQTAPKTSCCCKSDTADASAKKAVEFVSGNWSSRQSTRQEAELPPSDWDEIINQIRCESFSISAMAFQDAWNVNLDRIRDCCIHVATPKGKLIPFCMYNLTNTAGKSLYRNGGKG